MTVRKAVRILLVAICLLMLCLLIGCTEEPPVSVPDTTAEGTSAEPDQSLPSESETDPAESGEAPTEPVTEPETEPQGWEQDTGPFNEGKVTYEKVVETQVFPAYPDEKLGQIAVPADKGAVTLFATDYEDQDVTAGGQGVNLRDAYVGCVDGRFYVPYDGTKPNYLSDESIWSLWSHEPAASLKEYKQVQLSAVWEIYAPSTAPWITAMWGCYISNYTGKIPDRPGDGLWLSFQKSCDTIYIYHPDKATWPSPWAGVTVEHGLMNGSHGLDIVCTRDNTTYVYITPEGSDTPRLVCTVRFEEGKIRAFDEANNLVAEDTCTTDALKGDHFSLFIHGGGGAIVDSVAVLGGSEGGKTEQTTVTATPAEGHTLGLDITDKTDLVSICYSVWFNALLGDGDQPVETYPNVSEVLAGKQEWGGVTAFHYWAKPAAGYYRSTDKAVIRTHMTQLYSAGVDFIIIDNTFMGDGDTGNAFWGIYVQRPMEVILDTIMEMRAEGLGTPYVVFWSGDSQGSLYQKYYDHFYSKEEWKDCFVYWDGKPLLLTVFLMPADFPLKDLFTVRAMFALSHIRYEEGQWGYLSTNNYGKATIGPDGHPEQVSVAVACQRSYMSDTATAIGRQGGMFWYAQWRTAFDIHPKIVTLTWWNEWAAQRLEVAPGVYHFTDNYNQEYSRDIEPMEGGHGDQYYRWMIQYISAYKGGLDCPVLVEEGYEKRIDRYMTNYEKGES